MATRALKQIYLVRHAESLTNRRQRALRSILKGKWPSFAAVKDLAPLLLFPMDAALSERGEQQVRRQRVLLDEANFIAKMDVELVVHSPYVRARDTAKGCFAGAMDANGQEVAFVQNEDIHEMTKVERIIPSYMRTRTEKLAHYLLELPQNRIVVVGHSLFFEEMVGAKMENVDVWSAKLDHNAQWSKIELLHPMPIVPL